MNKLSSPDKELQILVIDDMPTNIRIAAFVLKEHGYSILAASDGKQGVAIAKVKQPDLILLDIIFLANRQKQALTICFIDLNKLKFVNDTYGHKEGDRYITLIVILNGLKRFWQD